MMMKKILAMAETVACVEVSVYDDRMIDIIVDDGFMFSWDESPELINLLKYLEDTCERYEASYGCGEYCFSDDSIVLVYSKTYED